MSFIASDIVSVLGLGGRVANGAVAEGETAVRSAEGLNVAQSRGAMAAEARTEAAQFSSLANVEAAVPAGVGIEVSIQGALKVERRLAEISRRLDNLTPVMARQIQVLEERERSAFGSGYVDTGRLRASLTDSSAPGAVREVTPHGLKFGTDVWYGKYQVENPGPETARGGLVRKGHKNAVMKELTAVDRERIVRETGSYVMGGVIV